MTDIVRKTAEVAKALLNSGKSVEEIVEIVQKQSQSAQMQSRILDGFNAAAQEQGRYSGGTPTLGDEISDKLAFQVKKYGKSARKISNNQVSVIIYDVYGYRKV